VFYLFYYYKFKSHTELHRMLLDSDVFSYLLEQISLAPENVTIFY